ncbi:hypothetical protein [Kingella potus]|uniref:hypothetical protein n=1 Tax=Kingella potus TaxID=265175 RepID=UPI001FD1A00A|nr:hypothetical protein [Kingella potus]UOP01139.1 hypothetical protein LVJ84_02095 [Kingella potus]
MSPWRRTRSLPQRKSRAISAAACVAAPHTLPKRQRPSENGFSDGLPLFAGRNAVARALYFTP